jgi:phosphoribosyl 1,2-cyclic phosphate phosphodiesterase
MKLTILGCGSSTGVPVIGCGCAVCVSPNPKNKRTRASLLWTLDNGKHILIDTSPDLREQALRSHITSVDSIIMTHAHADHCHGIDEVRSFNDNKDDYIDFYADAATMNAIASRFAYVFREHHRSQGWYKPCLIPHEVTAGTYRICDTDVVLFHQQHGKSTSLGVRIGNTAYTTDANALDEAAFDALQGIDLWMVDCLRFTPAPTHAHLDITLEWIARVRPKRAILTHMAHEIEYEQLSAQLPSHISLAYDGMMIDTTAL